MDKPVGQRKPEEEIKIADRALLEERAANNGTVIIIKNGVSQLVSARRLLEELKAKESGKEGKKKKKE